MQGLANICVVLSAVFWLAADFPLSAEVVSLAPVADTSLFEYSPDNNIGGAPFVTAGVTGENAGNSKSRGLLKFDLAPAIPAGARINAARLVLQVTKIRPVMFTPSNTLPPCQSRIGKSGLIFRAPRPPPILSSGIPLTHFRGSIGSKPSKTP